MQMVWRVGAIALVGALCLGLVSCASSGAYKRGRQAWIKGEWDTAVVEFRQALQEHPDRTDYKGALQQAMSTASLAHLKAAREADERGDIEVAVVEYRRVYEYDPSNRNAMLRAAEIDKEMRERAEAARPRPAIEAMRETARQRSAPPLLNPASRDPLEMKFPLASSQDILTFIGKATGINVIFESTFRAAQISVDLTGLSLEEGLSQVKGIPVLTVSAKTGKGIDQLLGAAFEIRDSWSRRVATGELNRWFERAVEANPPPAPGGKRIKLRYITQIKSRPPAFVIFGTRVDQLPKSYERYLLNSMRRDLKLGPVPLRLTLRAPKNPYDRKDG